MVGNCLLVYALVCLEDLRRVSNIFFLCLASFDILVTLTLPFWAVDHLHHWVFGIAGCQLLIGAFFVGQHGGLMLLTAMTLDRFCTVVLKGRHTALSRQRLLCARIVCTATWVISIAASLREALNSRTVETEDGVYLCEYGEVGELEESVGYYMQIIFLFLLPFVIIVFCYSCILRTVMSVPNMRGRQPTVVLMLCIVTAFFTCWGPYNLVLYLLSLDISDCETQKYISLAHHICQILAYSHCCINPVLYMLRPRFRTILCRLVCCSLPASQPISLSHMSHNAVGMHDGPNPSTMCVEMMLMEQ